MAATPGTLDWYINNKLTHSLHNTEYGSYRGCRRRWSWIFHDGYYPIVTPRPLEFGVAYHAAMEEYYGFYLGLFVNPDPETALALSIAKFKGVCDEQYKKYLRMVPESVGDPEIRKEYNERVELGVGMLRYYFKHVAPEADKDLCPEKVEISFEVPIKGPEGETLWCKCDRCWKRYAAYVEKQSPPEGYSLKDVERAPADWKGLPVTYGGRIDAIFRDRQGRYWIVDWKTAMRLSGVEPGSNDDFMWNDPQITSYCWALWMIGFDIAGFIYAEIKKAVPEEPEPNKTIRLGRRYSINKQLSTTAELYEQTVKENDTAAYEQGLYDEMIEHLRTGTIFHKRHQIHRIEDELIACGYSIWQQAKEMVDPHTPIYPNPGRFHCQGMSGFSGCAYWEPCIGQNRGEDFVYTLESMFEKRTKHYWEDAKPTTDKYMEKA
jgi:hypothetical protein